MKKLEILSQVNKSCSLPVVLGSRSSGIKRCLSITLNSFRSGRFLIAAILISSFTSTVSFAQEGGGGGGSGSRGGSGSIILSANAGVYNTKDDTAGVVNNDTQVSVADGTLGYVFSSGIYLGGIYGTATTSTKGAATKPETSFSGGSLGYFSKGGFIFQGHYIASAEIKKATATTNKVEGTGSQFDVGFIKNLWGPIFVGGQISTRTIEYKKLDTGGVKTLSKHTVTETFPELKLCFVW